MLNKGQLKQIFYHTAQRASIKTHVFCPINSKPTTQVYNAKTIAAYNNLAAVKQFAKSINTMTYEFENIPTTTAEACAKHCPIQPKQQMLTVAQNQIIKKTTLQQHNIPIKPFAKVKSLDKLQQAAKTINSPTILKTSCSEYDNKNQHILHSTNKARLIYT